MTVNRDALNALIAHYGEQKVLINWDWSRCVIGVLRSQGVNVGASPSLAEYLGITVKEAEDMVYFMVGEWRTFDKLQPEERPKFVVDALVRLRDTGKFSWRAQA